METLIFRVDGLGEPIEEGVEGARACTMDGVAKCNAPPAYPYTVANEFIAGRLALLAGLPASPGAVFQTSQGELAYISMRVGDKGDKLPPADPEKIVADHPKIAAGIVVFDAWVANFDRHRRNLAYSKPVGTLPAIFDHGHALLGKGAGGGVPRLSERRGTTTASMDVSPR